MQPNFYGYPVYNPMFSYFFGINPMIPGSQYSMPYIQPQINSNYFVESQSLFREERRQPSGVSIVEPVLKPDKPQKICRPFSKRDESQDKQLSQIYFREKRRQRAQKRNERLNSSNFEQLENKASSYRQCIKNIESNIVNQIFSFLWSQFKSKKFVNIFLKGNSKKCCLYYQYIKIIKKCNKRQLNKEYLTNLTEFKMGHLGYAKLAKQSDNLEYLSIEQFSKTVKFLTKIFLSRFCALSIVTSRKMRKQVWLGHLKKARQVEAFIFFRELQIDHQQQQQKGEQEKVYIEKSGKM